MATLLTEVLGRKISHVNVDEEDIVRGMVEGGVEENLANVLGELDTAVERGEEARVGGDLEYVVGEIGGEFEEYVEECVRSGIWDAK